MKRLSILVAMLGTYWVLGACKDQAQQPAKKSDASADQLGNSTGGPNTGGNTGGDSNDSNTNSDSNTNTNTNSSTDCTKNTNTDSSSSTDSDTSTDDTSGSNLRSKSFVAKPSRPKSVRSKSFGLTTTYSYDDDIKSILDNKCGGSGCHSSGEVDPDLSTYANAKAQKAAIKSDIDGGKMPIGSKTLTSTEKTELLQWISDGAPQSGGSSSDSDSSSDTSSNCDTDSTSDGGNSDVTSDDSSNTNSSTDSASAWEDLINPQKLKDCKNAGKIYDRAGDKCHKASIASSYQCTRSSILAKFKSSGVDLTSQLAQMDTDQYVIDQCGEFNGDPIVYFYKKDESNDELKLSIRKICKKNSAACTAD